MLPATKVASASRKPARDKRRDCRTHEKNAYLYAPVRQLGMLVAPVTALMGLLPATGQAANLPPVPPVMTCESLTTIDFTRFGDVPMRIDTATVIAASATTRPQPYCRVTGYAFPQVHFEVHLPMQGWTQRFYMAGCGGYCGAVTVPFNVSNTGRGNSPFSNGEMVIASHDAGHVRKTSPASPTTPGPFADGLFALNNPDALVDFAYKGVHKATLAAKALINVLYGQMPKSV